MVNFNVQWEEIADEVKALRRKIHEWPETAFEEYETQRSIIECLIRNGITDYATVAGTGVIVDVQGIGRGQTVAFRADMDGIKLSEEGCGWTKSKREGYMHACGHDAHVAIGMTLVLVYHRLRHQFSGCVRVIFQPAEEMIGGAKPIVEAGYLRNVSAIVALHLWPELEEGTIGIKDGVFMASNDRFDIHIQGKAAHGARPDQGIDPVYIGSCMVKELMTLRSREINPSENTVVNVCSFNAGQSYNAIPTKGSIQGTVRTLNKQVRHDLLHRIPELCKGIGMLYCANVETDYFLQYPILENDPAVNKVVESAASKTDGIHSVVHLHKALMLSEDYGFYTNEVPGTMVLLGIRNEDKDCVYPLHNSRFCYDEESTLKNGSAVMFEVLLSLLDNNE